jgi:SNF2 family DNA or RNA helicase
LGTQLAMKKPIKRVTLLQDVLSDFLEVEGILSKLQIVEALQLTAKQMQLYKEIVARVNELVRDLTNDVAQEHDAA